MPIQFQVGKLSDKTIIETMEAIEATLGAEHLNIQSAEVNFTSSTERLKNKKTPTYILTEARIQTKDGKFTVRIFRDSKKENSVYFDEIIITPQGNPLPTADELLLLEDIIRSKIRMPSLKASGKSESSISGLLEKEMATIASMHDKLMADALDLRKTYELQDAERKSQFEQDQRDAEKALKEREQASLDKIAAEREELDEKLKQFDFSDHMRARRKLREDISKQVQQFLSEPQTSTGSRYKFIFIVVFCILASAGSGFFAFESFQSFIANSSPIKAIQNQSVGISTDAANTYLLWLLAIRGALLSAVAIGFLAYLVSVLRRTYDEDVRSHRELQRYGMDINRASWVIETAMEMTTKENAILPEKWIEGAVHGLFQSQGKGEAEVSSLAALGTIMGLAPEVSVGPDGAQLKFSPKATKKAAKDNDKD